MHTLKLCAAPTRRQTTLLGAIARSVADLERTGQFSRTIRVPARRGAFA